MWRDIVDCLPPITMFLAWLALLVMFLMEVTKVVHV